MPFRRLPFLALAFGSYVLSLAHADDLTIIEIKTLRGQMKYDLEEFRVPPGGSVRLTLKNEDDMHHNLIICKPGKDIEQEVAKKAWELGAAGFEKQWIPEHPALLFATPMADPQKSVTLEFIAPSEPGIYPYVCSLPGHSMIMNGKMIVAEGGTLGGKNGLIDLTFMLYEGNWDRLPDFSSLTPIATDHVKEGLVTLTVAKKLKNGFGIVFRGKLKVPADADYEFKLRSDDGSRLSLDGKELINHDGIHEAKEKKGVVNLTKGSHDLELQYFDKAGQKELQLSWSGPSFKDLPLSDIKAKRNKRAIPEGMPLAPSNGEAIIYRNFIEGAGPRAIGVGYPGGVNLAYDADQMRVALVWQGGFIDAARHWTGRGQGFQPPLGYNIYSCVEGAPLAQLASPSDPWPDTARKPSKQQPDNGYVFKGYRLDGTGRFPEFRYLFEDFKVTDLPSPAGSLENNNASIKRKITVGGNNDGEDLYFRAAKGTTIEKLAAGVFRIDDKISITVSAGSEPTVRDSEGKKELLVPIKPEGGSAQVELTYSWN